MHLKGGGGDVGERRGTVSAYSIHMVFACLFDPLVLEQQRKHAVAAHRPRHRRHGGFQAGAEEPHGRCGAGQAHRVQDHCVALSQGGPGHRLKWQGRRRQHQGGLPELLSLRMVRHLSSANHAACAGVKECVYVVSSATAHTGRTRGTQTLRKPVDCTAACMRSPRQGQGPCPAARASPPASSPPAPSWLTPLFCTPHRPSQTLLVVAGGGSSDGGSEEEPFELWSAWANQYKEAIMPELDPESENIWWVGF